MNYYIALVLPVLIPLIIFVLMIRQGAKKKILIASAIIGLLGCVASVYQGAILEYALMSGIMGFLLWYIILDVIHRIFIKSKSSRNSL